MTRAPLLRPHGMTRAPLSKTIRDDAHLHAVVLQVRSFDVRRMEGTGEQFVCFKLHVRLQQVLNPRCPPRATDGGQY